MNAVPSSLEKHLDAAVDAVKGRQLPGTANMVSLAAIAWGVAAAGYGLFAAGGETYAWTWGAILVGLFYTICLGQGGGAFAFIITATQARWSRPLKRVAESFMVFLPVAWLLLLGFLVGGLGLYTWNPDTFVSSGAVALAPHSPEALPAKELWLEPTFFVVRQLACLGLLILIDVVYLRASLKPDLIRAKARLGDSAPGWWDSIIGGATDAKAAHEAGFKTQNTLVPFMGFAYALLMSFLAFDLIMSLSPWWFSNMFGGWIFMTALWIGMCGIGLTAILGQDWLGIRGLLKVNVTHDLGKLVLANTMFWAYTLYAQILPIYYTNVAEETDYLLVRMFLPEWSWLAQTVAVMCFIAPFTMLLSRGLKKMQGPWIALGTVIMVGVFLNFTLLVQPSVYMAREFPMMDFLFISVGVWAGFMGLFVQVVGRFLAQVPGTVVGDELIEDHPWDVHVHSLRGEHH